MPNRGARCGQTGVSLHVPDPFPVRSFREHRADLAGVGSVSVRPLSRCC